FRLLSSYRHVAKAGAEGVEWFDLGLPTVGEKATLARRVLEYLRAEDMLLHKLSPKRLLAKALKAGEKEKRVTEIVEAFLKYPNLPMLESNAVAHEAVVQGVQAGVFGVRSGARVYFKEEIPETVLEHDAVLMHESEVESQVLPTAATSTVWQPPRVREDDGPAAPPQPGSDQLTYTLRARISWDKLADFVRGVVTPLHQDGAELTVEVSLEARSQPGGFKKVTLEQKVRETLRQIAAEIREEKLL
ncbi:MAG: hypothetical protein N2255_03115, partial [Kiritimatiellae bacterium]|nr:hypothetical protein [Kiritimatiellia bacterium]